jgi:hypothetical protein
MNESSNNPATLSQSLPIFDVGWRRTKIGQTQSLHPTDLVEDLRRKAAQLGFYRDGHGSTRGSALVRILGIWIHFHKEVVHEKGEKRMPSFWRTQEGGLATTVEEKDVVENQLGMWIGGLVHVLISRGGMQTGEGCKRTYCLRLIQEDIAHALGVKCEQFRVEQEITCVLELKRALQVLF